MVPMYNQPQTTISSTTILLIRSRLQYRDNHEAGRFILAFWPRWVRVGDLGRAIKTTTPKNYPRLIPSSLAPKIVGAVLKGLSYHNRYYRQKETAQWQKEARHWGKPCTHTCIEESPYTRLFLFIYRWCVLTLLPTLLKFLVCRVVE